MTDSIYRAFSASEWEALEKRHAERGGRAVPAPAAVRSDSSTEQADGLVMTEVLDGANRPIRTFAYPTPDHPKTWMEPMRAVPQRMMYLNKDNLDQQRCERIVQQRLADERQIERQIAEHGAGSFRVDLGA